MRRGELLQPAQVSKWEASNVSLPVAIPLISRSIPEPSRFSRGGFFLRWTRKNSVALQHHPSNRRGNDMTTVMLNTPDAAAYLDLQKATLETWRCLGRGPPFVKMGRLVKYRVADLDAYIESRRCTSTVQLDD